MNVRPALLAAAALAIALSAALALGRGGKSDLSDLARVFQRGQELDSHVEAGRRRHGAKRALAAEVIAGRVGLGEAAGYFRGLDESDPGFVAHVQLPPRDEAFYCEQVLDHVWEILAQRELFAAATRQYSEAFAADPDLLASRPTRHRYLAACAAARAACGQGRDAAGLDEPGRAAFRRQALGWLRDELEAQRRRLEAQPERGWSIAGGLTRWLRDPYFAWVREPEALARLPAAERQAWQTLWADVADTVVRAEGTTPPETKAGSKMALRALDAAGR
jgi:hypothetical protein